MSPTEWDTLEEVSASGGQVKAAWELTVGQETHTVVKSVTIVPIVCNTSIVVFAPL